MNNISCDFEPIAEISLSALRKNAEFVRDMLGCKKLVSVVKSNAYGHGLEICQTIDKYSNEFAVSKLDEAITLRFLGITKPISILIPQSIENVRLLCRYGVQIPCHSLDYAKALSSLVTEQILTVNLKVDSGMNRLGFSDLNEFETALKLLAKNRNIRLYGVYSHFSCAESSEICKKQYAVFKKYLQIAQKHFSPFKHISASGGLLSGKYTLDGARVGLLLYGYCPSGFCASVQPVMKITAQPIAEKIFNNGERGLYNFSMPNGKLGLVNYGYGDGLSRNSFPKKCMDLSYQRLDGNRCIILDDAQKLADELGTIPYEIMVNATKRLKKVYI